MSEQYAFVFLNCYKLKSETNKIELKGPYYSKVEFYSNVNKDGVIFNESDIKNWNDTWSFPALSDQYSADIFRQLRTYPRLDHNEVGKWRTRPDSELHATAQKSLMDLASISCPNGFYPVYKGKSFNIWEPDTKQYYAFAHPDKTNDWISTKRINANKRKGNSPHKEFDIEYIVDKKTLPVNKPRIAFRDITRATDKRTVIASLVPAYTYIQNSAPYLLWPRGDEKDQSYLLGILCSIPLDWYARRFVELHLNYFVFNPLPIPRPSRNSQLWQRVVKLSGRLSCPDERFSEWAKSVGVEYGSLDDIEKLDKIHELDAVSAHLYGLSEKQLTHIFETFREGWDGQPRLNEVMKHYNSWKKELIND